MSFFTGININIERTVHTGTFDDFEEEILLKSLIEVDNVLVEWGGTSYQKGLEGVRFEGDAVLYFQNNDLIKDDDVFIIDNERYIKAGETRNWNLAASDSILEDLVRAIVPIKHFKGNVGQ